MARALIQQMCLPFQKLKCCSSSGPFSVMDVFVTLISIGSFIADIGTDIMVIIQYYKDDHIVWMFLTLSLVCIPSLIVQVFSIRWYITDGAVTNSIWILHVMQLGIFTRYVQLLQLGFIARRSKQTSDLKKFYQQQSDICMLRLFESFTESAPQLVLQLYIMVSMEKWNALTGLSAAASVLSLSWGISAYSKAMRNIRPEKNHLSWWGLILQAMWRIGMVSSRVISMVLFAIVCGPWLIFTMSIHWLCMTIWVFTQNTDFCSTWLEERLYNCIVGAIYCFCFFNLKEGRSRYRMTLFYLIALSQNTVFVLVYYFSEKMTNSYKDFMVYLVPMGMATGLCSMLLYYRFFHPSGPILVFQKTTQGETAEKTCAENQDILSNCSTLKTCRKTNCYSDSSASKSEFEQSIFSQNNLNNSILSQNNLNKSILSAHSLTCGADLHRSHSFNCSFKSFGFDPDEIDLCNISRYKNKKSANHHTTINYNFRPGVAFGRSLMNTHCSCMVLSSLESTYKDQSMTNIAKLSLSMPNLEVCSVKSDTSIEDTSRNLKESQLIETSHLEESSELVQNENGSGEVVPETILQKDSMNNLAQYESLQRDCSVHFVHESDNLNVNVTDVPHIIKDHVIKINIKRC